MSREWATTGGNTVTVTIRANTSAFAAAMDAFGRAVRDAVRTSTARRARRARRLAGFHPEQPHRSAMHTAYRAKTRRRGRR